MLFHSATKGTVVIGYDLRIKLGDVTVRPGDLTRRTIMQSCSCPVSEVILAAWNKATAEDEVRIALQGGLSATQAYQRFGVL